MGGVIATLFAVPGVYMTAAAYGRWSLSDIATIPIAIGEYFLRMCTSLSSIDLTPLRNARTIQNGFLCRSTALTSVDLTPLTNVTSINATGWLYDCLSLSGIIDLTPFRSLQ